jgi:integrase
MVVPMWYSPAHWRCLVKAKVSLVARVNDGTGAFPRVSVHITRRAIVIPLQAFGKFFNREDIIGFYARYSRDGKRRIEPLGKDPVGAYTRYLQLEQDFSRVRVGLLPINDMPEPAEAKEDRSLRACATQFKANIVTLGKKKATLDAYSRAVDDLVAQYADKPIDRIDKHDMLGHIAYLRMKIKKRGGGDGRHTFRNRLRNLTVFFNSFGVKNPLPMRELKKPMRKRPTRYSIEIVNLMLGAANENEKDLIHFLLETGFRDEEVAFAKWSDLDLEQGSVNVHAKPEYEWTHKDNESREQDIVLQNKFIKRMKARHERGHNSALIFPNESGMPDMHLIRIIQRVAKRAGIKDKQITLHAFRRTFGSIVVKAYGIEQARIWLGQSDIETTQRYIAAEEMTTEQSRQRVNEMFSGVGD